MTDKVLHCLPIPEVLAALNTREAGLSQTESAQRLLQVGANVIPEKKRVPWFIQFAKHLFNLFALLLWVGAILAFVADYLEPHQGMLFISIALFIVIFLNAGFTFFQEFKAEQAMRAFKDLMPHMTTVLQNGQPEQKLASELVPGDILRLREGDKVPADAIVLEANELKVNNAALTGESAPQLRSTKASSDQVALSDNILFSGTIVSSGTGKAVVFATGANAQIGEIAELTLKTTAAITPIQRELRYFIRVISSIAMVLGILFFVIGHTIGNSFWSNLIFAIGIIVANVPEGLLPTVTLSLSIAAQRLARKKVLIKTLESVETLGSTSVICSDKTGTLTEGVMAVKAVYFNGQHHPVSNLLDYQGQDLDRIIHIASLCNNASFAEGRVLTGDHTESALLKFVHKKTDIHQVREQHPRHFELPFNSERKMMITAHEIDARRHFLLKGAPEAVLTVCQYVMDNEQLMNIDDALRQRIKQQIDAYAGKGERVLALAYKQSDAEEIGEPQHENDYVFAGLVSIADPVRDDVTKAVHECQQGGIKIIIFSGDHPLTVEAIANEVGIIKDRVRVITGQEMHDISDAVLSDILQNEPVIFARTMPQQKLRVVSLLQKAGSIVAVTGDGVNDAPALKKADIGVAMGLSGTDVAKEAADMILVDDNFSAIVNAIQQGRTIFDNIKKFIAYVLTSNIPEILPFIAFVLLGIPLPLTILLILAIDLGTDLLPALGLGQEQPESDVMAKAPRQPDERLLTPQLLFMSYGIIGMIQALAGFFAYFYVLYHGGWHWGQNLAYTDPLYQRAISAYFFSIIIVQIADVLICRVRRQSIFGKGIFTNSLVNIGIITELALAGLIIYTPWFQRVFNTHSLSLSELSLSIPFALVIFFGDELRKFLLRRGNLFVQRYLSW